MFNLFFYHGLPIVAMFFFLVVTTVNFRKGYFHVILYIFILRRVFVKMIPYGQSDPILLGFSTYLALSSGRNYFM